MNRSASSGHWAAAVHQDCQSSWACVRALGPAASDLRGEVRAGRAVLGEVVAVDDDAAGAQQGRELPVGAQQDRFGEAVQGGG
ncbi:hypothetical protein ACF09Y_03995 [Streptomyces massasporeus]|uniref:hypothetical protein n=1 Tax=Streptomyces massasporeus TaxID=67324 RepID=UPI0036F57BA0